MKQLLALILLASLIPAAWALAPFKIGQIRAEGLQRLEIGTVLSYLPLSVGDELNDATSRDETGLEGLAASAEPPGVFGRKAGTGA